MVNVMITVLVIVTLLKNKNDITYHNYSKIIKNEDEGYDTGNITSKTVLFVTSNSRNRHLKDH